MLSTRFDDERNSEKRRRPRKLRTRPALRHLPINVLLMLATAWSLSPAASRAQDSADENDSTTTTTEEMETTEAEVDEEDFKGVEEMTVEARRRSENLQKIGESVSSFSATDILDRGLVNFNDLQYNVPSLFSGGGLTRITLRGVGSEIVGPGIDPGFAVHVNGVFSAREGTGLSAYYDIERVDVLRGPQGTLWGRNSTGGAVNIVTKKAEHEFDVVADVQATRSDNGAAGYLFRGMLNTPLVEDKLALRVALLADFNDGEFEMDSADNNQQVSDANAATLRASLRWQPHEDVTVDLIGTWLRSDSSGAGRKFQGQYFTPPGNRAVGAGAGVNYAGALANPSDPYKGTANEPQRTDSTVYSATLLVGWQAENFKFDSITGYQSTDFFTRRDQDASDLPISVLELTDKSRQLSQEFLVTSTWDHPFDYTVGTIYQYDWTPQTLVDVVNQQNIDDAVPFFIPAGLNLLQLAPDGLSLVDNCPPPNVFGFFEPTCPDPKLAGDPYDDMLHAISEVENHVFGLYANFSWEVLDGLTLSAGGRFSYTYRSWKDDTVARTYVEIFTPPGGIPSDATIVQILQLGQHLTDDWKSGTWKVGIEYEVTDNNLLWASVGTGSRAGGFNFTAESSFGEERILAYEAGIKNAFFDHRLIFNVTGYFYDWEDPQIGARENGLPIVKNAPSARSYGVEFDWVAIPYYNLTLNGSFGWLEAFYDADFMDGDVTIQDFTQISPLDRVTQINLNRNRLPRSPRFTVSVGGQYMIEIGQWGTLTPRVDFYYRDEVAFRQYGNPLDVAPSYTRTDVRLTWRSATEQFWGEVFVQNLENEAVQTNQEVVDSIYRVSDIDAPLTGGVRIGYSY